MVNFPAGIPDCGSLSPALLNFFFLLTLVFVLQWLFPHREILIMCLSQFPLAFQQTQSRMPRFIAQLMTILVLISMVFVIIWEMFHGRISLNSTLLLLLNEFREWVQIGIDIYISLIVSIRSNLIHLHDFQQLALLPQFIEIFFFVCTNSN